MTLSRIIKLTVLLGLLSSGLLFYFYINQRNFTKDHKEFLLASTNVLWEQSSLSNNILQSSLEIYFNQDIVSKNVSNLLFAFEKLENANILKSKNYEPIKRNLYIIKEQVDIEIKNIEQYTMINAGVKNSMLFLSRHVKNYNFSKHQKLYLQALLILQHITDAKNTLDLDNLNNIVLHLDTSTNDKSILEFVNSFNDHTEFLQRKLPKFIHITKMISKNDISQNISNLNNIFSRLALADFKAFDEFALVTLLIFAISLFLLATFFYKYINEQKKLLNAKASLEHALIHDELTGLKNRKSFEKEILNVEQPYVLIINIVGFKNINDIYGNNAGNELLKEFSIFIKTNIQDEAQDNLYRLGSDEFSLIYPDKTKKEILDIASCLESEITSNNFDVLGTKVNIQVNIAINNIKPYLENADLALKLLKNDYSKSVLLFEKNFEIKKNITEALKIIDTIKNAISDNNVVPFFQPIVNIQTMKIEKYEALIRIMLEDGRLLQPHDFLELAKKSSYYNTLTKIMIEKTLDIARKYPKYRFSINISMQDINNDELLEDIFEEFDNDPDTSSRLDIELLESDDMYDKERIINFINRVNSYGISISIDDFGTGYSNFSYFSDFNVDYLKIDGSIVKEIATNPRKLHILKSICDFSNGMHIDNIAEYIESREILDIVQELGIKYGQGYYFSRPILEPFENDEIILT